MNTTTRTLSSLAVAACLVLLAAPAQAHGRSGGFHGGGHGGGWGWRGPVVGIGVGVGLGAYYGGYWGPYYPYYPGYVVVDAPPAPVTYVTPAQRTATSSAPDPVIYPRNNQTPAQTEADRQECNRWATSQQAALADASIFQRAVAACMDGRGYTLR